MVSLPALITSGDLLPGGGALNGRRWAGQQLLKSWASRSGAQPMALASSRPESLQQLLPLLRAHGFNGDLNGLDLLSPEGIIPGVACSCLTLLSGVGLCGGNPLARRRFHSSARFTPCRPRLRLLTYRIL